eukprot:6208889-Pleurochrysis_carterae.AAC.2
MPAVCARTMTAAKTFEIGSRMQTERGIPKWRSTGDCDDSKLTGTDSLYNCLKSESRNKHTWSRKMVNIEHFEMERKPK